MSNLGKALVAILGSAVVYTVVSKIADKICGCDDCEEFDDVLEETMDEIEENLDEDAVEETVEVVENIFYKIGKEIKGYMKQATNASKEKLELCLNFVTNDKNRRVVGIIVATLGVGIFASSYIN